MLVPRSVDGLLISNMWRGKKKKKWSKWTFQLEFQGFGNPSGEHWLGNEFVSQVTGQKRYVLKIHLRDWEGNEAYSLYDHFYLSNEELNYRWGNYMSLKRVKRLAGSQNPTVLTRIWTTQIRSDQSLSRVRLFATPWIAACQASLSITKLP